MGEKTEKATPKKLRDARKKGQVAKSQDFPSACTFIVSMLGTLWSAEYLFSLLGGYIKAVFSRVGQQGDLSLVIPGLLSEGIAVIAKASAPLLLVVLGVGVVVQFLIVGPVFSSQAVSFQLKRLNPVDNIKNKFKLKTLFELLKSLFKITGAVIIIWVTLWWNLKVIVGTVMLPILASVSIFADFLSSVIIRVGIFFLVVAVADLMFQRRTFAKEMRMEKFEVKQEFRDTEGDPHIKQRRRQVAQEIAYQEGPETTGRARAIVTNPTHIAVAIDYEQEEHEAPVILFMGQGVIADRMLKIAIEFSIPILRNPDLARILYEKGEVDDYIPEETFEAVAELLKWVENLEEGRGKTSQ